jgi:hypothetical protein
MTNAKTQENYSDKLCNNGDGRYAKRLTRSTLMLKVFGN